MKLPTEAELIDIERRADALDEWDPEFVSAVAALVSLIREIRAGGEVPARRTPASPL